MDYRDLGKRFENAFVKVFFVVLLLIFLVLMVRYQWNRYECRRGCIAKGEVFQSYGGTRVMPAVCVCGKAAPR